MTFAAPEHRSLIERALPAASRLVARSWPLMARLLPEKLEIDDNHSVWAASTPDYRPLPPLKGNDRADLVIIGGGFTGVSAAYHFSRRYPEKRVVLVEAKSLANGASGRNGGMMLNWVTGVTDHSPELTARIYRITSAGIQTILDIIARHNLPVSFRTDGTITVYTDAQRAEAAHAESDFHHQLGIPSFFIDSTTLRQQLDLQGTHGAVLDPFSGLLNGAQYVRSLRPVLLEQGVTIYEGTPVLKLREGRTFTVTTSQGEITAGAVLLATNGYTGKLGFLREALFPLHSHVFATERLTPDQLDGLGWRAYAGYSDDLDRIAYSSLTPDGHIIFGGGSNHSYAYLFRNQTAYPGLPESARRAYEHITGTMFGYLPASRSIPIAYRWTGTLGITLNRTPLMGVMGEHRNLYYAVGYCGHGVTLANIAGQVMTDLVSGDDENWRGLPFYQAGYVPIPPDPFRWIGYQTFTRLTGRSPRV